MPNSNPKQVLLELLSKHHEIKSLRGSDVVAINSKAILYLRYNKNAGPTKKYSGRFWFGITKSEYDKYSNLNLFIVCACLFTADNIDYLVFPSYDFDEIKRNIPLQSGQWKFNLLKTPEGKYMLQVAKGGMYDVTEYLNFLDFTPKDLRKNIPPSFTEIKRPVKKIEKGDIKPEIIDLENELLISSRDSSNPKRFEVALERFFLEIGFKCRRIGGSGETDVLVYEPVKMIIDGKSTKSNSKSAINFTRIKRHKAQSDADNMVIASVRFDPAVGRDAELEQACLIEIESLIEILKIHNEYILSPYDYMEIFQYFGIVNHNVIANFRVKYKKQNETMVKVICLIENMDFNQRTIDEIKGRLDLYCEQKGFTKLDKDEIIEYLSLLSSEMLKVVSCKGGGYLLQYTPKMAKERLRNIMGSLCAATLPI